MGTLEAADAEALAALQAAQQLARRLSAPHHTVPAARSLLVHALVRLGQTEGAERALAELSEQGRGEVEVRIAAAGLQLALHDPHAALSAPVLDRPVPVYWQGWLAYALVMEANARHALGDDDAAETAIERALDIAEPFGAVLPFVLHPAPGLLGRYAQHRGAHASLIASIQSLLAGITGAPTVGRPSPGSLFGNHSFRRQFGWLPVPTPIGPDGRKFETEA